MSAEPLQTVEPDLDTLTAGRSIRLEDLIDRDSLREVIGSFTKLFGISARVFSADGDLLADAVEQQELCALVNETTPGQHACGAVIQAIKQLEPSAEQEVEHPCFTGARYRVAAISYDARRVGRLVLGPYLPADVREVPASLLSQAPHIPAPAAKTLLPRMPRARPDTVTNIANHMGHVLDLILFSGHKALLTSQMHLASVRESYRELQDKNVRLQHAYDRLKELDRLKSNFIATVSHELRTPLTSIIGYSEMLDEGIAGKLLPEQTEFVRTIREKGEQLLSLIMSLLDLSKLESGAVSLTKADTDLCALVRDVLSLVAPAAKKKPVSVDMHVEGQIPALSVDANRLRQALVNLVDNAVKFTPSNGHVRVAISVIQDRDQSADEIGFALLAPARAFVEIRVADSGIGIPEHLKQKVFEPFFQVDSSSTREYGGTGLGLAIVKRLVDAHDAKIHIEDNTPTGAVVVVRLPVPTAA